MELLNIRRAPESQSVSLPLSLVVLLLTLSRARSRTVSDNDMAGGGKAVNKAASVRWYSVVPDSSLLKGLRLFQGPINPSRSFPEHIARRLEALNSYKNPEWGIFCVKHYLPEYGTWLPRMTTGFDHSTRLAYSGDKSKDVIIRTVAIFGYNGFFRDGRPREKVTMTFCPVFKPDEIKLGTLIEKLSDPPRGEYLCSFKVKAYLMMRNQMI